MIEDFKAIPSSLSSFSLCRYTYSTICLKDKRCHKTWWSLKSSQRNKTNFKEIETNTLIHGGNKEKHAGMKNKDSNGLEDLGYDSPYGGIF